MYNWFSQHKTDDFVIDYLEEYMEKFMMDEFHDEIYLKLNLASLDDDIGKFMDNHDMSESWKKRECQSNIMKRIEIMRKLNSSLEEMAAYRNTYWQFSEVRKQVISECIVANEIENAIEVLKESKEIDKDESGLVAEYSKQLIELYPSNSIEYENELLFYVYSCRQNDLDYIIKLKQICNADEWKKQVFRKCFNPKSAIF